MRLFGRSGRPDDNPRLDARLREIFDDKRTPDAPDILYSHLREIPMSPSTESNRGRFWFLGSGMGPKMRAVATVATVLVVAAGALGAVAMIARTGGVGATASPSAEPSLPAAPSAPAGWHTSFGQSGGGLMGFDAEPRIAVHVLCQGPEDVIVMARTYRGIAGVGSYGDEAYGQYSQSALINCLGTGWQDSRFEFTAATGTAFLEVYAAEISIVGGTVPTRFWISVEIPD
jgi:hypothetical protein